jgi:hypothetical protein
MEMHLGAMSSSLAEEMSAASSSVSSWGWSPPSMSDRSMLLTIVFGVVFALMLLLRWLPPL